MNCERNLYLPFPIIFKQNKKIYTLGLLPKKILSYFKLL